MELFRLSWSSFAHAKRKAKSALAVNVGDVGENANIDYSRDRIPNWSSFSMRMALTDLSRTAGRPFFHLFRSSLVTLAQ